MKTAVIGANGQLGTDLCRVFRECGHEIVELDHKSLEVADFRNCEKTLGKIKPDVVLNAAAMHHVELCEKEPAKAFAVNALGPRNLALLSALMGFKLVHFSTDYVFDGAKSAPYTESDLPLPLNVYGTSKLAGEIFVRRTTPHHFVARISAIYGEAPCRAKGGLNFVRLMLKLARERKEIRVVADEVVSPTYARDVATQVERLTRTEAFGLYHMTSQGSCSWYEFALKIFELAGVSISVVRAQPEEFPHKVNRPKYSVLDNVNLRAIGMDVMPTWEKALEDFFLLPF